MTKEIQLILPNGNIIHLNGGERRHNKTRHNPQRVPAGVVQAFRYFEPRYLYREGVRVAFFRNVSVWRETGEHVAFYERTVQTVFGDAREKYAWVMRNGRFVEVRQFGLRDVTRRIFMGL